MGPPCWVACSLGAVGSFAAGACRVCGVEYGVRSTKEAEKGQGSRSKTRAALPYSVLFSCQTLSALPQSRVSGFGGATLIRCLSLLTSRCAVERQLLPACWVSGYFLCVCLQIRRYGDLKLAPCLHPAYRSTAAQRSAAQRITVLRPMRGATTLLQPVEAVRKTKIVGGAGLWATGYEVQGDTAHSHAYRAHTCTPLPAISRY